MFFTKSEPESCDGCGGAIIYGPVTHYSKVLGRVVVGHNQLCIQKAIRVGYKKILEAA